MRESRFLNKWKGMLGCACALIVVAMGTLAFSQVSELDAISTLVHNGNLPDAEQRLRVYLKNHPRSTRANNLLGTVYLKEGRFEPAEEQFKQAIAADGASAESHINLGDAYAAAGHPDSALAEYGTAAKLAPTNPRVNVSLAKLYLAQDEFEKSLEAAARIPAEKRTNELLPTLAADYFGLKQPDKAGVEIQAMLDVSKTEPDLVAELAEFFIAHRDFNSSQQLVELAQSKQLKNDRLQVDLALTQAGLGHLDDAQNTLELILEHKPDSIPALVAAGKVASQQLNWTASIEAFTRAASLAPERPDIFYGLVTSQLYANQPESALKNAQKLQSLSPDDSRVNYVLALAFFGVHNGQEAKRYAQKVLEAHPEDREMHLILADVALNDEHDLSAARKQSEICLKSNPNDPGALFYLGMTQKMDGDVTGAIQNLAKSVAGNPKNADAQGALGALALQTGDVPRAVQALEQAVLLAPEEPQNHYQLALGYSRLGSGR